MSTLLIETEQLLTLKDIMAITRLGRTTIYNLIKSNDFPRQIKLGNSSRWLLTELNTWIDKHRHTL